MAGIPYRIGVKKVKSPYVFVAAISKTFSSLAILIFMLLMICQFIATNNVGFNWILQTGLMLALAMAISTEPLAFVTIATPGRITEVISVLMRSKKANGSDGRERM